MYFFFGYEIISEWCFSEREEYFWFGVVTYSAVHRYYFFFDPLKMFMDARTDYLLVVNY